LVHGWKHDARSDDGDLQSVQRVLGDTVQREQQEVQPSGGAPRPVLGVFVGWRGMSLSSQNPLGRQRSHKHRTGRRTNNRSLDMSCTSPITSARLGLPTAVRYHYLAA
jgi:hypothetical protein